MKENIVEKIRNFVREECKKPTSKYGYEPYENHFLIMRNYAVKLAKELNADLEIVEIAAWLHDIGSIIHGREDHHLTGVKIAEEKLRELGYSLDKIEKVKHCILVHRGSKNMTKESIEAQIIADADAMSNFDNLPGIFKAAFVFEKQGQGEAKQSARKKLSEQWNKLSLQESRNIIRPKYEAAMLLLGEIK